MTSPVGGDKQEQEAPFVPTQSPYDLNGMEEYPGE